MCSWNVTSLVEIDYKHTYAIDGLERVVGRWRGVYNFEEKI